MERHNQIDHVLTDRRQQSSTFHIRSFRGLTAVQITIWWLQKLRQKLPVRKLVTQFLPLR